MKLGRRCLAGPARPLLAVILVGLACGGALPPVLAHGDLHDQIRRATRAIDAAPQDAALRLTRGELYRAHHEPRRALADYAEALRLDPSLHAVYLARGRLQLEAGVAGSAVTDLSRFLQVSPAHPDALVLRGRALARLGRLADAIRDYDRALAETPSPDWALERARLQRRLPGGSPAALDALEAALARLGPLVTLELEALDIERALGRHEAALGRIDRLLAASPRPEPWLVRRGQVLTAAGRTAEASAAYTAALAAIDRLPTPRRQTRHVRILRAEAIEALAALPGTQQP